MTAAGAPASAVLDSPPYVRYPDLAAYQAAAAARDAAWLQHADYERKLSDDLQHDRPATIWCPFCEQRRHIHFSQPINWREDGVCEGCGTNARMRFSLGLMQALLGTRVDARVYLTEQLSRTYAGMRRRFPRTTGSEFMTDPKARRKRQRALDRLLGRKCWQRRGDGDWLRHEDITRLSFTDGEFDLVGCFDVLEHVPSFRRAIEEIRRVLKPHGALVLTAPFVQDAAATLQRARIDAAGKVKHICPAEYHTSSIAGERHLCYYHFGWDLLDVMREAGFPEVSLVTCWSPDVGIFGTMDAVVAFKHPTEQVLP